MPNVETEAQKIEQCCSVIEQCAARLSPGPDVTKIFQELATVRQCCQNLKSH